MPIDDDNKEELNRLTYNYDDTKLIRNNIVNSGRKLEIIKV